MRRDWDQEVGAPGYRTQSIPHTASAVTSRHQASRERFSFSDRPAQPIVFAVFPLQTEDFQSEVF